MCKKAPERAMALRGKALTAIILALVFLALALAPTWSMAVLILFGMIAAGKEMRKNLAPAVDPPALAHPDDGLALLAVEAAGKESSRSPSGLKRLGTDTRATITDVGPGISVFEDDEDLDEEDLQISPIGVFSRDYAFSTRCFEELAWFGSRSRIIVKYTDLLCKRLVDVLRPGELTLLEYLIRYVELDGNLGREVDIKRLVGELILLRKLKENVKRREQLVREPIRRPERKGLKILERMDLKDLKDLKNIR